MPDNTHTDKTEQRASCICDYCAKALFCGKHLLGDGGCHDYEQMLIRPYRSSDDDRTTFATGAVRDASDGKGRFDLLPWAAIWELARHCERGAKHYGERNVDKGIPTHSLIDSGFRHLCRYMLGHRDEPHLIAALWNIAWAVQMEQLMPDMQDIPSRKDDQNA